MASNQDNSEQMAVNDKLEQMYVSELIEELEQCREDERSSRNQMIAILRVQIIVHAILLHPS